MRCLARAACLAALSAWAGSAHALDPDRAIMQYVRESWTTRDGAPAGTINAITQTPIGYLWLGTQAEGLVRFDGVAFVRERVLDVLFGRPIDRIISLTCGRDGTLWAGTMFGVARLKDGQWTALDRGDARYVFGLHESPNRVTWYASNWESVAQISGDKVTRLPLKGKPMFLTSDTRGNVWAGGYEGLWRLSGQDKRFYSTADGLLDRNVTCVFGDRAGNVWIGAQKGLTLLRDDKVTAHFTTRDGLSSDNIKTVFLDRDDVLWVGTVDGGLNRRRGARFETLSRVGGLTNNRVTAIFEDRESSLWIGTANGLNRLRDASVLPMGESEGLTPGEPTALAEGPDGSVYVATGLGGLSQVKDGTVRILRSGAGSGFDGPVFVDPNGGVWSGHEGGLARTQGGRRENYEVTPHSIVRGISRDVRGLIFANTDGPVFRLVDGRAEPYRLADGSQLGLATFGISFVRMIRVGRDGTLWLATNSGLIAVRNGVASQVWSGLLGARSIFEDERGIVWSASDAGIVRVANDGSVALVTEKQGLPQNRTYYVVSDRAGRLWIGCARGVFCANRQQVEDVVQGKARAFAIETFGVNEGMRSSEAAGDYQPAACVARDGRLWFAMTEGLVVIDPNRLQKNKLPPPVLVESVTADGRELPLGPEMVVPAGADRIEIHYNGLSLLVPFRVRFKYLLEPFDKDWVDAGPRRMVSYTNLAPQRYRFRMIAFNNDGLPSETEATLAFRVLPRWFQTWRWYSLVGLLACGLAAGLYQWRVAALKARQRELKARVAAAMADIKTLHGLLPICAWCKKVRDDGGYWNQLEEYVSEHTQAEFSHGICPECREQMRPRAAGAPSSA
jgi:ligand-binding sensor domain-containing protein